MPDVTEKDRERAIVIGEQIPTTPDEFAFIEQTLAAHRAEAVAPLEAEVARLQVLADARQDMLDANAATARAKFALLVEALEPFREKLLRKERGPWHHGFGCPAEHDGSDNAACTCGAWAAIDRLDAALARAKESAR